MILFLFTKLFFYIYYRIRGILNHNLDYPELPNTVTRKYLQKFPKSVCDNADKNVSLLFLDNSSEALEKDVQKSGHDRTSL